MIYSFTSGTSLGFLAIVSKYYPEESNGFSPIPDNEPCLVIGLSFKQYDVLKKNGIRNVAVLMAAMKNPN